MSEVLKKSHFDPYLNEKFQVNTDAHGLLEVELVEITEKNTDLTECFSILFRGPRDKFFDQKLYQVNHAQMGEFNLFLVPVLTGKQDAIYYEAIFNRLLGT